MKKNRIFGALSALSLLLAGACSNELIDQGSQNGGPNGEDGDDGLFVTVNFDLPSAKETRSSTDGPNSSTGGVEIGHDYENTVSSAYIVLATTDNTFITASKVSPTNIQAVGNTGNTGVSYRSSANISKTDLSIFYGSAEGAATDDYGNYKVNVYVFVNPTEDLVGVLTRAGQNDENKKSWFNEIGTYEEGENVVSNVIWKEDNFLMSNNEIATRLIPPSLEEWSVYSSLANAFNLSGMNNFGRPNQIDNLKTGNVLVERAAARYDFRDGALDGMVAGADPEEFNGCAPQTYHVVLTTDKKPLVDVKLGKMSMVNMNKKFYYLRRVSPQGTSTDWSLCGPEMPWYPDAAGNYPENSNSSGNYVVDAYWDWKVSEPSTGFPGHFNYPFFNENGIMNDPETRTNSWYTSLISDVLTTGVQDSWNAEEGKGKYRTWRYLTEGTIPGRDQQQNGISNGIVFKGQLLPARKAEATDDEFTQKLLNALTINSDGNKLHDPILYAFGGHLYCTWEHIRRVAVAQAIIDGSLKHNATTDKLEFEIDRSNTLYHAVFGDGGFGKVSFSNAGGKIDFLTTAGNQELVDDLPQAENAPNARWEAWKAAFPNSDELVEEDETTEWSYFQKFRDAAVAENIALYQTSEDKDLGGWGYYCYYYYWNRHNDNGLVGIMGPMEFAVVRNNVYKLAVTKIARLGHPRIAANDPDAPTPNTPDEKGDVYITVTCTTLPWVVRENNIHLGE